MRILVFESQELAAVRVASEIIEQLEQQPELVLGLATGSTPIGVYERLIRAHKEGADFSRVHTFNLDEYMGLAADHPQSYRRFMQEHLFHGLNVPKENIHFPPADGPQLEAQCHEYEDAIRDAGGIDIQILGIGSNGHIGFNEPTSSLTSRTRIKTLADKTLRDNARFYSEGETPPQVASTMGIGTILEAKRIFLLAFGEKKVDAIHAAVEGPVTSRWPGSALQLHPDVTLYLDEESASGLQLLEYYKRTAENDRDLREKGIL